MEKITRRKMEYMIILEEERKYLAMKAYELGAAPADDARRETDKRYNDLQLQWWAINQLRGKLGISGEAYRIAAKLGEEEYGELRKIEEALDEVRKKTMIKRRENEEVSEI